MIDSQSNRNSNFKAAVGSFWWLTRLLEKEKKQERFKYRFKFLSPERKTPRMSKKRTSPTYIAKIIIATEVSDEVGPRTK